MGVPYFYSWLIKRYPVCLSDLNNIYIDNLYFDMNQVIYRCSTNPQVLFRDLISKTNLDQIWMIIYNYISYIIDVVNPHSMIFFAFDGVAPRAKMNQQRQRRFQSALKYTKTLDLLCNLNSTKTNDSFSNNQISVGT